MYVCVFMSVSQNGMMILADLIISLGWLVVVTYTRSPEKNVALSSLPVCMRCLFYGFVW
jgi:hypothetical protein